MSRGERDGCAHGAAVRTLPINSARFQLNDEGLTVELPLRYYDQAFRDVIDGHNVGFYGSAFGLNRPTDGERSLFQAVLEKFDEKTVVFSYDQ
jgi:hypothetical protein